MGLFLDFSGIAGTNSIIVEKLIKKYVDKHSGIFQPMSVSANDLNIIAIAEAPNSKVSILHRGSYLKWYDITRYLSYSLKTSAFFFQIHDGDLWMYELFVKDKEVDAFNPIPEYWGDITKEEQKRWSGNARIVCKYWPGIKKADICNYLRHWEVNDYNKSYQHDKYTTNNIWQISDFMRELGLICPVDEEGNVTGNTYHFEIKDKK